MLQRLTECVEQLSDAFALSILAKGEVVTVKRLLIVFTGFLVVVVKIITETTQREKSDCNVLVQCIGTVAAALECQSFFKVPVGLVHTP